ncbi:MAG: hypothetical protein HND57_10250 [Planctomycetes bacterium]|nr:hypothetical protein [Planctomycetota bacterium]
MRGQEALTAAGIQPGVDDETDAILDAIVNADLCVLATPLFCWTFSALLMQLIERMTTLVTGYGTPSHDSQVKDKGFALLVTAAGPIENNAELLPVAFDRLCEFSLAKNAGHLVIPLCSNPEALADNADARGQAEHFAASLLDGCA